MVEDIESMVNALKQGGLSAKELLQRLESLSGNPSHTGVISDQELEPAEIEELECSSRKQSLLLSVSKMSDHKQYLDHSLTEAGTHEPFVLREYLEPTDTPCLQSTLRTYESSTSPNKLGEAPLEPRMLKVAPT